MNYFVYKGIRSCDMGIRIESKDVFSAPEYEVDFLSIPGNQVTVPSRNRKKIHLIFGSGKDLFAFNAESHIRRFNALIYKVIHANTTPFRFAN